MRYKYFYLKLLNMIAVLVLLALYGMAVQIMYRDRQIAELQTRVNQLEGEKQDIIEAIDRELGADTADPGKTGKKEEEAEGSGLADGTYTGSGQGFGGQIVTEVTVEDSRITNIEITESEGEDPAYLKTASEIIDEILEKQSVEIDTVSGATFSSGGILEAVGAALKEAEK